MGVLKFSTCLKIFFVCNKQIYCSFCGRRGQEITKLAIGCRCQKCMSPKVEAYHLTFMSNLYSMEKDISAMFFLINHVRFDLLTLRSCLFHQDQIQSILCSFLYFSQVIRPSSCKLVIIGVGYISDLFFLYSNTFMIIFSQSCISNWLIQNKHLPLPFQMFA